MSEPTSPEQPGQSPRPQMPEVDGEAQSVIVVHITGELEGVPLGAAEEFKTSEPVSNFFSDRLNNPAYVAITRAMLERMNGRVFDEPMRIDPAKHGPIDEDEMPSSSDKDFPLSIWKQQD